MMTATQNETGSFVRVIDEPGLYRVEEDRGDRLLLRGLVRLPIQPTRVVRRDDVRVIACASELSEDEAAMHMAEMQADCDAEDVG